MKQIIKTDEAPAPVGPYNQAIISGNFVFVAGQIALDPATGQLLEKDVKTQTQQMMKNMEAVLKAAGSELAKVVKTTIFLDDMNNFAAMNEVYGQFFKENAPARSAIEVARLPKDAMVEIECIATLD